MPGPNADRKAFPKDKSYFWNSKNEHYAYNLICGWRFFFYSNERTKPIHVHAEKGDMECKYWLLVEDVEIREAFSFNVTPAEKKQIKKIIYQHFDLIIESWNNHFNN